MRLINTPPIDRPIVHFAHGNSFPSGTYRRFLASLGKDYDVHALEMHAHNPTYPVTDGWPALAQELVDELLARYQQPVILVGHSLGGALSLMAAKQRPDLVRCVVLLDTPVLAGWRAGLLALAKVLRLDRPMSPARFSEKRRNLWPDAEAAYQHFSSKQVFASWPEEVLRDYVEHGLVEQQGGMALRFRRDIETAVYRTLPHHFGRVVRRRYPVPVGFIGGMDSIECRQAGMAATRRLVGRHLRMLPGGHLFPLETPLAAASATDKMIRSLLNT
ncbi:alpha/beta fold hydrolase [Glaciimonas sp. PCH181]|uniref:alpha/beta fold hydrolase n=1 Tax=Glaciimonas sp. PCH181 TaxID=2133943 RepID=UPI000D360B56|nr:alpha/beta hydrolase [Glaciimonas sp. PCH181]PUA19472.1 alpha/beta hydrolase [Glaciimonas sp. PCH181]